MKYFFRNRVQKSVVACAIIVLFIACTGTKNNAGATGIQITGDTSKINIDLSQYKDDGEHILPNNEFGGYIHYEFCIPATEEALDEVQRIDSTAGALKKSKGRSGCSDQEWLIIGSSRQINFKQVLLKLSGLSYIRKISQTFWE
jgi:hypothetical protein